MKLNFRRFCILLWLTACPGVLSVSAQMNCGLVPADDLAILEIVERGVGMTSFHGDRVFFRMYRSGRVEFEDLPNIEPEAKRTTDPKDLWRMVRREVTVSRQSVEEIIRLAEQPSFLNAAEKYPVLENPVDYYFILTIIYSSRERRKSIKIWNYQPKHPKAASYYPASLRNLLQKVKELRPKDKK